MLDHTSNGIFDNNKVIASDAMIMYNGKANYTAAALKATVYVAQYDDDDAIIGWALDSFASAVVEDAEVELFNTDSDETIEVILVTDADK